VLWWYARGLALLVPEAVVVSTLLATAARTLSRQPMLRHITSRISFSETLRWGFLLLLPAAVVGSVAAWPGFRTLSVFRLLYVALAVGVICWLLNERRLPITLHVAPFLWFLAFWVAWSLVSLVWAADRAEGIRHSIFLLMMVSLSGGAVLALNRAWALRAALLFLMLVFAIALGIGFLEITTDFRLPTSALVGLPERYQWAATSFFYNQNDFATYIALWLPLLLAVPFFTQRTFYLLAAALGSFASALCLLYTGSRANLLAFMLAIPSLLFILALRRRTISARWQWTLGVALITAVACTIYLGTIGRLPILQPPEIGVQHWRFATLEAEMDAGTGSGGTRMKLLAGGLAVTLESRLLGVGPGNAEYHLQRIPGLEKVYSLHNWWLEVLVTGGLFVFVGYLIFFAGLLYALFRVATRSADGLLAFTATALFAALIGYTIGALAPSSASHFTPMWIHFGLGLATINLYRDERGHGRV
jgi:teichuronic acid biosynthesis protein TuaE